MNTDLPLSKPFTRNNIFWISRPIVAGHRGKNEVLSVVNVTVACIDFAEIIPDLPYSDW